MRIFLSLLAGKFKIFKQMLTRRKKKTAHAYFKRPYFYGKIFTKHNSCLLKQQWRAKVFNQILLNHERLWRL